MKITAFLSCSALFMATLATAVAPDDPNKIDTCVMPGVVAYTFDDGPGAYNDQLLAILAKKNVKATFFVLGSMIDENPAQAGALKKILDAGHQLASHTYSHSNLDNMTDEKREQEMTSTSDLIFKHAGVRPRYMRAPEGSCAEACTKFMTNKGLVISHWNVDTNDWRFKDQDPKTATENSMKEINDVVIAKSDPKTDSFILLQHEIHKFSVDFLADLVIDAILKKGYRFVTMEECVGQKAYLDGSVVPPPGSSVPPAASGTTPASGTGGATVPATATGSATRSATSAAVSGTGVPDKSKPTSGAGSAAVTGWTATLALGAAALCLAMI